jgi:hypothetical protein
MKQIYTSWLFHHPASYSVFLWRQQRDGWKGKAEEKKKKLMSREGLLLEFRWRCIGAFSLLAFSFFSFQSSLLFHWGLCSFASKCFITPFPKSIQTTTTNISIDWIVRRKKASVKSPEKLQIVPDSKNRDEYQTHER